MALLDSLKELRIFRTISETLEMVENAERIKEVVEREEKSFFNKKQNLQFEKESYELKKVYWERYDKIPPHYQTAEWIKARGFEPSSQAVAILRKKNCRTENLYNIHHATCKIPGADIFFEGKIYKEASKIPYYLQRLDYFEQHQLKPKTTPSAKLLVNNQFYVDYYEIPAILNASQRQSLNQNWLMNFKGDVYACPWDEIPSHLKQKKELEAMNLPIPEKKTAFLYTGKAFVPLYALETPSKNAELTFTTSDLEKGEWLVRPENYIMLDTETTGLNAYDEIIQLALVNLKGEVIYQQYFKPSVPSSPEAYEVHKLSDEFLATQPRWSSCWPAIEALLKDKVILIQNASFDIKMFKQTCGKYHISSSQTFQVKDTLPYFRKTVGVGALKKVMTALNIKHDDSKLHDAVEDCLKTIEALNKTLEL